VVRLAPAHIHDNMLGYILLLTALVQTHATRGIRRC